MREKLILLLALVATVSLFVALDADPSRLLWRDFITDEGWWTAEARDRALFGHWVLDEYNQGLTVPLASLIWLACFELLGVSLWSARLPMALASVLILMMVFSMPRRARDAPEPVSAWDEELSPPRLMLLLASALPFVLFARFASPEALSLCLVTASWWLLLAGGGQGDFAVDGGGRLMLLPRSAGRPIVAGLLLGAALSAKLSAVVAMPAMIWLAQANGGETLAPSRLMRWRPGLHLGFAAVLALSLLRLPFLARFPLELSALEGIHRGENLPRDLVGLLANIAHFPWPSPFLYQTAPLIALAGIGAWQSELRWRGRSLISQALAFCLLAGLAQSVLSNPADRRFVIFLPALAILAARGWRALAAGEAMKRPFAASPSDRGAVLTALWATLVLAYVLPGRMAIWFGRLMQVAGRPLADFHARTLASLAFMLTLIAVFAYLSRRTHRAGAWLRGGLVATWIFVCLEPFDFLIWAGLAQALGKYDAGRVWLECGAWWSIPWGLVTLGLVWLPLARSGRLPGAPVMERGRRLLPLLVPILALLMLAPTWLAPSHSLRDAGRSLAAPLADGAECLALVGPEAPSLTLSNELRGIAVRGDFNRAWLDAPPPGARYISLMEDSGRRMETEWPAGADTLRLCPQRWAGGAPRFVFAVMENP